MPLKPCIDCGELSEEARCPEHRASFRRERARGGGSSKWARKRERVFRRDNYRCRKCGRNFPLEVDHVNGDRQDDRMENLQTLCHPCHVEKHRAVRSKGGPQR